MISKLRAMIIMADDTMEVSKAFLISRSSIPVASWVCEGEHITIKEITITLRLRRLHYD